MCEITNVSYLTSYTKMNLRWKADIHVKSKMINLPEENPHNKIVSKDFLERLQKAIPMKG